MTMTDLWFPSISGGVGSLFVQQAAAVWSATTISPVTIGHNTTKNNVLIAIISLYRGTLNTGTMGSITDSQSNTWTTDVVFNQAHDVGINIARATLTTALTTSDTVTIPVAGGNGTSVWSAQFLEFNGAYFAASPFDKSASTYTASSFTTVTGTTGTLTQANELVITGCCHDVTNSTTWTAPGGGFIEVPIGLANNAMDTAYQHVNATTALNPTWTSAVNTTNLSASIATYKLVH